MVMYGNFYVYDSIGPVADLLQRQRGFNSTQIGMLNAIYNLPNVVLILVGGVLIDRYGAARVTLCTAAVCLAGAALTAFSPSFAGMAAGRLLFGIGNETFNNAMIVAIAENFAGGNVAFAMGLSMGIGRLGSFCADMSPTWFAAGYRHGWQPPLMIATLFAAVSFAAAMGYWRLDRRIRGNRPVRGPDTARRFVYGDLLRFGSAYWYLLALCVLWYAVIFAFRSTFSIEYFQHAHGLDLAAAGAMNSYVFLAGHIHDASVRVGVRPDRPVRADAGVRRAAVALVDRRYGTDPLEPMGGHRDDRREFFIGPRRHVAARQQTRFSRTVWYSARLSCLWYRTPVLPAPTLRPAGSTTGAPRARRTRPVTNR